ncbi:MAG: hypothetical protein ACREQC_11650 [Candidatus Binataceae bacterium]
MGSSGSGVQLDKRYDMFADFAKTVLNLSGGALVLSVTFLHDIVGFGGEGNDGVMLHPHLILAAWISFLLSVVGCLVYLYFLVQAADKNQRCEICLTGGILTGFLGFFAGLLLFAYFGWVNIH